MQLDDSFEHLFTQPFLEANTHTNLQSDDLTIKHISWLQKNRSSFHNTHNTFTMRGYDPGVKWLQCTREELRYRTWRREASLIGCSKSDTVFVLLVSFILYSLRVQYNLVIANFTLRACPTHPAPCLIFL